MARRSELTNAISNAYLAKDFALATIHGDKVYALIVEDFADVAFFLMENDGIHVLRNLRLDSVWNVATVICLGYTWDFDKAAFEKYGHAKYFRAYHFEDMVAEKLGMVVNTNRHAPRTSEYDIHSADGKYGIECKYVHARVL
jgi:hypothetical protein